MSRLQSALAQDLGPEVRRWLPPDVGVPEAPPPPPEPPEPEIPPPTPEEIEAIREQARLAGAEAGFREGYQKGYQEGRDQAAQEAETERRERQAREQEQRAQVDRDLSETVAALEGVAKDLADPLASLSDDLEPELLALTVTLAERVIMDTLDRRPELLQQVLQRALTQLPSRQHKIRVHVHPDEQSVLETYAQAKGESIIWVSDPELSHGGCIVESGPSRIDASLDTRLRQAVAAIWGDLVPPASAASAEWADSVSEDDIPAEAAVDAEASETSASEPLAESQPLESVQTADESGGSAVLEPLDAEMDVNVERDVNVELEQELPQMSEEEQLESSP